MIKKDNKLEAETPSARQKADDLLEKRVSSKTVSSSEIDVLKLLHELEVHQIELEMQNDELQAAVEKAETATALYDFAPSGYFTLDLGSNICELNLCGAAMLGKDRSVLVDSNFRLFITQVSLHIFNDFYHKVFESETKQTCEVSMSVMGDPLMFVYLEGIATKNKQKCLLAAVDITKRILAERSQLELQDKLKLLMHQQNIILENANAGIVMIVDNKLQWVNRKMEELFQFTREEMVGRTPYFLFTNEEEYEIMLANAFPILEHGRPFEVELKLHGHDGIPFHCLCRGQVIDLNDLTKGSIWILEDITARKQAEEAFRASAQMYHDMFEKNQAVKLLIDPDNGLIIDANSAASLFYGYTIEQFKAMKINNLNTLSVTEIKTEIASAVSGNKSYFNFRHRLHNGEIRDVEVYSSPLEFNGRTLLHTIVHDNTARKQAEEKLRKSETRYHRLFESTKEGILILDAETGQIVDVNPFLIEMLGFSYEELIGKELFEIGVFKNIAASKDAFIELQNKEYIRFEDMPLETKDGKVIDVEFISNVYLVDHKKIIQCNIRNITDRKLVEKELIENETRLLELNATKDKFFSIIAHDLRNLFNSIIGFSDIIERQVFDKDFIGLDKYARIVQNSSHRAMSLLTNLLVWARSQTGKIEFNPESVEILLLITEVTKLLHDSAQHKSISIYIENQDNIIVMADTAMIRVILRNLISNAIKYTHPGGKIIISAERKQDELLVSVCDTGIGIKKDILKNLFRIDISKSTKGTNDESGTGMGLLLCKEFIDMHGGRIWAESDTNSRQTDKGSEFYFTIPLR